MSEIIEILVAKIAALEKRIDYLETVEKNVFSTVTVGGQGQLNTLRLDPQTELTIAAGVITATQSYHDVDTQDDDAADDLDTINGLTGGGTILILRAENGARVVTVKDGADNLRLAGDFVMNSVTDTITLLRVGDNWYELSRSNNA